MIEIKKQYPTPRDEQETIITHDRESGWHVYTDNPVHARKWEDTIVDTDETVYQKTYHIETGELIGIEGYVSGSASIRKKREISEEERKRMAERLREARK